MCPLRRYYSCDDIFILEDSSGSHQLSKPNALHLLYMNCSQKRNTKFIKHFTQINNIQLFTNTLHNMNIRCVSVMGSKH